MSRSYKKTPICQDFGRRRKEVKTIANRKVRREWNWDKIGNGNSYRRLYSQWDVCDHYSYYSFDQACEQRNYILNTKPYSYCKDDWYDEHYANYTKFKEHWKKFYYRK